MTEEKKNINRVSADVINSKAEEKEIPKLYSDKENCCGCSACYAICPVAAITMTHDEEGFLYPTINAERCVRCYRCLSVCDFKASQMMKGCFK